MIATKKKPPAEREKRSIWQCVLNCTKWLLFWQTLQIKFWFYLRSVVIRVFFKSLSLLFITKIPKISKACTNLIISVPYATQGCTRYFIRVSFRPVYWTKRNKSKFTLGKYFFRKFHALNLFVQIFKVGSLFFLL